MLRIAFVLVACLALLTPAQAQCQVTPVRVFGWRNDMSRRLDNLERRQQGPGADQTALILQLQAEIARLNAQLVEARSKAGGPPVHYHIYSPGGPPIALNPNPGPPIALNPNPGPLIPLNPNPGPVIPLNPNPGPVIPLNPNPGPPIQLIPSPSPAPGPPGPAPVPKNVPVPAPPTGYQTYTPYAAAPIGNAPATVWHPGR
jgi:hypothetical protein